MEPSWNLFEPEHLEPDKLQPTEFVGLSWEKGLSSSGFDGMRDCLPCAPGYFTASEGFLASSEGPIAGKALKPQQEDGWLCVCVCVSEMTRRHQAVELLVPWLDDVSFWLWGNSGLRVTVSGFGHWSLGCFVGFVAALI